MMPGQAQPDRARQPVKHRSRYDRCGTVRASFLKKRSKKLSSVFHRGMKSFWFFFQKEPLACGPADADGAGRPEN
jgi:hypothetical protein